MGNFNTANLGIGSNYIHTPSIFLERNVMIWNNHTMIQLSNISYLSAMNLPILVFPFMAALMILMGLIMLLAGEVVAFAGLILGALGGIWIYFWYKENERRKNGAILHIKMNSGNELNFEFASKDFLYVVADKLQAILINGGAGAKVEINISNSVIRDSSVLNGMNLNGR